MAFHFESDYLVGRLLHSQDKYLVHVCCNAAVKVHFKPIANAPILRKGKFQVNAAWTCAEVRYRSKDASLHSSMTHAHTFHTVSGYLS